MSGPTTPEPQRSIQRLLSLVLGYDPPSAADGGFLIKVLNNPEPYVVPGLPAAPADYYPTSNPTSLVQTANAAWADLLTEDERDDLSFGASGGFDDPLSLTVAFGTGVRFIEDDAFDDLVADAGDQIDSELLNSLSTICRDKYVFRVVRQFLIGDGGRFLAVPGGSAADVTGVGSVGNYDDSEMTIEIDTTEPEKEIEATLIHELLHYVFDKADSPLSLEIVDTGGETWFLDHPVIGLLAGRIRFLRQLLAGRHTDEISFELDYGDGPSQKHQIGDHRYLRVGTLGSTDTVTFVLEDTFQSAPWRSAILDAHLATGTSAFEERLAEVHSAIDSPAHTQAVVSVGMLPLVLYREAFGREIYPDEIYTDVAFLLGQFGVCLRRGWHEWAFAGARRGSLDGWDAEAQARMQAFARAYLLALQDDPFRGVAATERALRDW